MILTVGIIISVTKMSDKLVFKLLIETITSPVVAFQPLSHMLNQFVPTIAITSVYLCQASSSACLANSTNNMQQEAVPLHILQRLSILSLLVCTCCCEVNHNIPSCCQVLLLDNAENLIFQDFGGIFVLLAWTHCVNLFFVQLLLGKGSQR